MLAEQFTQTICFRAVTAQQMVNLDDVGGDLNHLLIFRGKRIASRGDQETEHQSGQRADHSGRTNDDGSRLITQGTLG
jgi:hypothetical protein